MNKLLKQVGRVVLAACVTAGLVGVALASATDATAQTSSKQGVKVGDKAPDFTLTDVHGNEHTLSSYTEDGKIVVLEWFNPQCPYVVKQYSDSSNQVMNRIFAEYKDDGVVWLAINSGAEGKQGYGKQLNKDIHKDWSMEHPILLDTSGKVGKQYGAKRTPEMFIITKEGKIAYHGAIDNSPSPRRIGDVNYVEQALKEILAGETVSVSETDPYGCSVKY